MPLLGCLGLILRVQSIIPEMQGGLQVEGRLVFEGSYGFTALEDTGMAISPPLLIHKNLWTNRIRPQFLMAFRHRFEDKRLAAPWEEFCGSTV